MVRLPTRFTQTWIEQTFPTLAQEDITPVLRAMARRGWTEDDFRERVYPHLPPLDLPPEVTPEWLHEQLPRRTLSEVKGALDELEDRGWPAVDLATSVLPYLIAKAPQAEVEGIVADLRARGLTDPEIRGLAPAAAKRVPLDYYTPAQRSRQRFGFRLGAVAGMFCAVLAFASAVRSEPPYTKDQIERSWKQAFPTHGRVRADVCHQSRKRLSCDAVTEGQEVFESPAFHTYRITANGSCWQAQLVSVATRAVPRSVEGCIR